MKKFFIISLILSLSIFNNIVIAQNKSVAFVSGKSQSGSKLKKERRKKKRKSKRNTSYTSTKRNFKKSTNSNANNVIEEAQKQIGKRYKYGGESPRTGFDCSGLVQYSYDKIDIDLPRTSKEQSKKGKKIAIRQAVKGDLVFFANKGNQISHVGIVTSNNPLTMIHASSSGVTYTNIETSNYWNKRLKFAKRIF